MNGLSFSTLLLDIEGTTSSIVFVHDVMFPFAKRELRGFLDEHFEDAELAPTWDAVAKGVGAANLDKLARHLNLPPKEALERTAIRLMDADAKSTGLKDLQGKIWRRGFESSELKAHVYDDVPPALKRWKDAGLVVYIYSSGSVAAQQLFFGHTVSGDLRPFLSGHFDTTTGPKKEPESYRKIATAIGQSPASILFFSDVVAELDAARSAGMQTGLMLRPGNAPVDGDHGHWMFENFDGISS